MVLKLRCLLLRSIVSAAEECEETTTYRGISGAKLDTLRVVSHN